MEFLRPAWLAAGDATLGDAVRALLCRSGGTATTTATTTTTTTTMPNTSSIKGKNTGSFSRVEGSSQRVRARLEYIVVVD
jgi:hypothetical protein